MRPHRYTNVAVLGVPFPGATFGSNFTTNQYQLSGAVYGVPSSLPGWTFTRASTGYAETVAGTLTSFASGAPRITDKGLLVEEARTNLLLRSQEFDNASWAKDAASVTADAVTSPDGTLTADMLVEDGTTANHRCRQQVSVANATAYVYSIYAKAGTRTWAFFEVVSGATDVFCWVNLATGALGNSSGAWTVTSVGNGWYRASVPLTTAAVSATAYAQVSTGNTVTSYAGDGTSGIYLWQADLQAGAFITSPIGTTTASATRAADVPLISGLLLPPTFTLFASALWADLAVTRTMMAWNDGTNSNRVELYVSAGEFGSVFAASGGATQINAGGATTGGRAKIAASFDGADYRGSANGSTITAATGKIAPVGATSLYIGRVVGDVQLVNNYVEQIIVYPSPQTQAQLNAATA